MVSLNKLTDDLNTYFNVSRTGKDPAFSRFLPAAYQPVGFDWASFFEAEFTQLFNGLMIRGSPQINGIFCASFLTDEILQEFIKRSAEGNFLFVHHPINMECGDPKGKWGRGFTPLDRGLLLETKHRELSIYSCHAPLDIHHEISTGLSIASTLHARVLDRFYPYADGYAGLLCQLEPTSITSLIPTLQEAFEIPYVDFEGSMADRIDRVAVVAGSGDKVNCMQEAEAKGAQIYIAGEIHSRIDNEYGHAKYAQAIDYMKSSRMSFIGLSHSASEFAVMKDMQAWFNLRYPLPVYLLKETKWWR